MSFGFGDAGFSIGLTRCSVRTESAEKALGLKSRGEDGRMRSLIGRLCANGDLALSPELVAAVCNGDIGDDDAPRPTESPLDETGETLSSGFAIRSPPSD